MLLNIAVGRLRVVTLGKEDRGYVATLVADKKDAKWMKKHLDARIKAWLQFFLKTMDPPKIKQFPYPMTDPWDERYIYIYLPRFTIKIN